MSALRVFSTGSLFVDLGAGPIELMTLQDITFTQEFQEKELRAAPGLVTVGKHAVLPAMSAQFAGQDEQGNPFTVTAARVHAPGLTLPFKLDDYAMPNVRLVADPDATDKVLVYQFTA